MKAIQNHALGTRRGLEDDSLEKAMKSGVLPEPEERNDYLEQRGGER
nr:MAG TPA: hypothetical protein [Caudoviricetes sp.]